MLVSHKGDRVCPFLQRWLEEDLQANDCVLLARTFTNERRREVRGALRSLSGLADYLDLTFQVPGPKVVIMISGGLPEIPGLNFALMVEEQLDDTSPVVRQRAGR